jgi:hypothetical protein
MNSFQQTWVHANPSTASWAVFDQKGGPYEDYETIPNDMYNDVFNFFSQRIQIINKQQ